MFTPAFLGEFTSSLLYSSYLPKLLLKNLPHLFFNLRNTTAFIEDFTSVFSL